MTPIVEVADLKKHFPLQRGLLARTVALVKAVDGVSFAINPGETLCLVGESGCGKSTVGKLLLRLLEPTEGAIRLDGEDITHLGIGDMRPHRKRMQMVFQDPYASLNPRMTCGPHRQRAAGELFRHFARTSARRALPNCSRKSACAPTRCGAIRSSFPAGSASASASRARSRSTRR